MGQNLLFALVKEISGSIPDEDTITRSARIVAKQHLNIKLSPLYHANGTVPKEVRRSPEIIPDRWFVVRFFRITKRATTSQILEFLDAQGAIHLGGLGLMLMNLIMPINICFLAFEDNNPMKMSAMIHHPDDTFQFGVTTMDGADDWDEEYGFVCVTRDLEQEELQD